MFIELTLTGGRGKAYFDALQISVVSKSSAYHNMGETEIFIGASDKCFNVEETPEEVLNKIRNAK